MFVLEVEVLGYLNICLLCTKSKIAFANFKFHCKQSPGMKILVAFFAAFRRKNFFQKDTDLTTDNFLNK